MRVAVAALVVLVCAWLAWGPADGARPMAYPAAATSMQEPGAAPDTETGRVGAWRPANGTDESPEAETRPDRAPALAPRAQPSFGAVRGRVQLADGTPAAAAGVNVAGRTTQADADGAFQIVVEDPEAELCAWLAGHQPAVVPNVMQHPEVIAGNLLEVTLQGPSLAIDGWLRLADGSPATGFWLMIHAGGAEAGAHYLPQWTAEDFAAAPPPSNDPLSDPKPLLVPPNLQRVGPDGAFAVRGLRSGQDYVLRAWNESTMRTALSPPMRAGTHGCTFVVPQGTCREHVRGRAIDRQGGSLEGVRVRLTMRVHRNAFSESYATGQEVRTDAEGRFHFERVPHEDLLLRLDGPHVVGLHHELRAFDAADDLLLQLQSLCEVRLERDPASPRATSFLVLDAARQPLRLTQQTSPGESVSWQRLVWQEHQDTCTFTVCDEAAWLVLERDGQEVRRTPILLQRGPVTVLRP